jgi:hypothetical protein
VPAKGGIRVIVCCLSLPLGKQNYDYAGTNREQQTWYDPQGWIIYFNSPYGGRSNAWWFCICFCMEIDDRAGYGRHANEPDQSGIC